MNCSQQENWLLADGVRSEPGTTNNPVFVEYQLKKSKNVTVSFMQVIRTNWRLHDFYTGHRDLYNIFTRLNVSYRYLTDGVVMDIAYTVGIVAFAVITLLIIKGCSVLGGEK